MPTADNSQVWQRTPKDRRGHPPMIIGSLSLCPALESQCLAQDNQVTMANARLRKDGSCDGDRAGVRHF